MLNAILLFTAVAASVQAGAAEQVILNADQVKRAGIATTPAMATLPDAGDAAGGTMLSGTVVPPTTATVVSATPWGGMVQELHVATLQTVRAGAPLVTLFSQQWMELQREYVEQAVLARQSADKLARDESLFAEGIIARVRLDESRSAAQLAGLALDQRAQALRAGGMSKSALASLASTRQLSPLLIVRAQAAGTVVELPLAVGQQAETSSSVAKIVRDGPLWVELQASRQQLAAVSIGDRLQVAEGCQLKVSAISPLVNGSNQTATLRAEQLGRNSCLKLNAFVEARLAPKLQQPGALAVPVGAVVRRGSASYVFVRNDKGFLAVPVQQGATAGGQVWVSGALNAGAPVAVRGLVAIKGAWSGLGEPAPEAKGQP